MHPHLTNLEFLVGALALIAILFIAFALLREKRRRNRAPFLNYFCTEFERDYPQHCFFSERDE
jgi:hypothetical protein